MFAEIASHLLDKGAHRGHIDDLEHVGVDGSVLVDMLANLVEHGEQGPIGYAVAGGSAQQQVFRQTPYRPEKNLPEIRHM